MSEDTKELTSINDAAKRLDVPYSSLYYQLLKGTIERHAVGPYVLIDLHEARVVMDAYYVPRKESHKGV